MNQIKIAFFDAKSYDKTTFDFINQKHNFYIKYFKEHLNENTVLFTKDFNAVCVFVNDNLNQKVIEKLWENKIELVALRCAGYNNVDLQTAYKKIHIVRVPAYSPYAVAEHAFSLILTLNRKIHKAYNRTREGNFSIEGLMGFDLYNKTIGVIGTGKIGKAFVQIAKGFGMKILSYDPYPDFEFGKQHQIVYCELEKIYRESDIISLHCPLTKENFHMINNESIEKMKSSVIIINTSRGGLIDTKALIDALKKKKIGGAGLDVYEEEAEYFFEDHSAGIIDDDILARILTFPNVIVTSHQAFFTKEALMNIAETTFDNIQKFFENLPLNNEICYYCTSGKCEKKHKGRCF